METMSPLGIAAVLLLLAIAGLAGWLLRGHRCQREKIAVSAGWQHQVDAQQKEHDRIAAQNTSLMEQVSQLQATAKDVRQRSGGLVSDLQEAVAKRDELQREIKQTRGKLEAALDQRDRLRRDSANRSERAASAEQELQKKDEKIARLKRELGRWQERVPPLVERFRERDRQVRELEEALQEAGARIAELESGQDDGTRIEAVDRSTLDGLDASNDQYDDTLEAESLAGEGGGDNDDLKRIRGIGPAIETTLNELGFRSLRQIADLDDAAIDRIAARLRGARRRIFREDWIGQARVLLHDGAGDPA